MSAIEQSASILINQPLPKVFSFVADPGNFPLWQAFVTAAKVTSNGPIALGTTYDYSFKAMGMVIETSGVITEFHTLNHFSYKTTSSPFPIQGGFRFKEVDGLVEVTAFGEAVPGEHFAMAKPVIDMLLGRELKVMLGTLKEVLEST
ncbi:SRPBCC family protein [Thermodesulfobacteriota bacterium]